MVGVLPPQHRGSACCKTTRTTLAMLPALAVAWSGPATPDNSDGTAHGNQPPHPTAETT